MRYLRLRWHSSIFIGLTILTLSFLLTISLLLRSTHEFEPRESHPHPRQPTINIVPFWSALNQPNIYDLYARQSSDKKKLLSISSSARIDELYRLAQRSRNVERTYPSTSNLTLNFQNFLREKTQINTNDTNTVDSDRGDKSQSDLSTTSKSINEHDKRQLRYFLQYKLNQWKINHRNDKAVSLAEIMRDTLLQDEPG